MTLKAILAELQNDTTRLGLPRTFSSVYPFLLGIEVAGCGGDMLGFTEWLIPLLSGPNNYPWEKLVVKHALGDERASRWQLEALTTEEDRAALASLFELIARFIEEKEQGQLAVRQIFLRYCEWLHDQEWFKNAD